ncbi:MAG: hypothetical protein HWN81_11960 [Candidatus Lokiarchaeota archaeon]|nr:hypothetical protein [Candidatus Lokiarchaeota archaeon]
MNKVKITFESEDREVTTFIREGEDLCCLEKVLECFENALKSVGFGFEGHLDFVEDEPSE